MGGGGSRSSHAYTLLLYLLQLNIHLENILDPLVPQTEVSFGGFPGKKLDKGLSLYSWYMDRFFKMTQEALILKEKNDKVEYTKSKNICWSEVMKRKLKSK